MSNSDCYRIEAVLLGGLLGLGNTAGMESSSGTTSNRHTCLTLECGII